MAATPDGNTLVTGHQDGTISLWPLLLNPDEIQAALWRSTQYCLSVDERRLLLSEELSVAIERRAAAREQYRERLDA